MATCAAHEFCVGARVTSCLYGRAIVCFHDEDVLHLATDDGIQTEVPENIVYDRVVPLDHVLVFECGVPRLGVVCDVLDEQALVLFSDTIEFKKVELARVCPFEETYIDHHVHKHIQ